MYLLQTLGAVALHPDSVRDLDAEPLLRGSKTLVLAAYLAERPDRSAPLRVWKGLRYVTE